MEKQYQIFADFYPFYLSQHKNKTCRRLHFLGSLLVLLVLGFGVVTGHFLYLFFMPLCGYGFAWVGHFFFEKNRPATFTYPLYSLTGDWLMFKDILVGKIKF